MKRIINKLRIDKHIKVGYGTAFFLLMISYLITLYANKQLIDQANLVEHSSKIINHIENVISNLKDGETGVRGYMIMKDQRFLDPYFTSRIQVDSVLLILEEETEDNRIQSARLDTLSMLIKLRYEDLHFAIRHLPSSGFLLDDTLKKIGLQGRLNMERIRSLSMRMQLHEENLLNKRSIELRSRFAALNFIIVASLILAFVLIIFAYFTYLRENRARRTADLKVDEYQQELTQRIEQLAGANKELIQMRSIEKFAATGRIARTIAHEVRNPLTNINLAIEQIKSDIPDGPGNLEVLFDMITRNSNRINQLITDLLNSTKFSELDNEKTAVKDILDAALDLANDRISLNDIKVEKRYIKGDCYVMADVDKIKIAFLNIIVNAIEAMTPGKGVLRVETRIHEDKCIIIIGDNGSGMDSEALGRLFEPYFTNKMKGTGLGLTNTQNIILNHKGGISVESEPGIGTVFTITLDAAK